MSILNPPKIESLQPVVGGGRLPRNRRRAFQAMTWPSFALPDSDFMRLKEDLEKAQTTPGCLSFPTSRPVAGSPRWRTG